MTATETPAPVVSVVLPTHIRGPFLAEALASVKHQDFVDWELLLVDDGSDDPAGLEVEVSIDPRMRVIHHTHGGVANARNVGLDQCRGSYVAFLDHDDVWYPNHLSVNVAALEEDAEAVAAHSAYDVVEGVDKAWRRTERLGASATRHTVMSGGLRPVITTLLARRRAVLDVGSFDPSFASADDLDLILKLVRVGSYAYRDVVTAAYRVHDSNLTRNTRLLATTGDRMLVGHIARSRAAGDDRDLADLTSLRKQGRMFYSQVGMRDARSRLKQRQVFDALGLLWWSLTFCPAGVFEVLWGAARRRVVEPVRSVAGRN